jgi:hypothetical protein
MALPKALIDFADRVGSTAVQSFVGALGAAQIAGVGDLKSAIVAAVVAAFVAVVKVLGVQAAQAANAVSAPVVTADTETVVKAIAAKLR